MSLILIPLHDFYEEEKQDWPYAELMGVCGKCILVSPPCLCLSSWHLVNETLLPTPSKPLLCTHLRFVLLKNLQLLTASDRSPALCHTPGR